MFRFKIMSKKIAETYTSPFKYILISITEPGEDVPFFVHDPNRKGVLSVKIHDVDDVKLANEYGYKILDSNQAENIIKFVEEYKDKIEQIAVHCHAGVSRSAGCAAALSKIYNGTDEDIFNSEFHIPNMHVYKTILNKAFDMKLIG